MDQEKKGKVERRGGKEMVKEAGGERTGMEWIVRGRTRKREKDKEREEEKERKAMQEGIVR
jgi:hypothetical protein